MKENTKHEEGQSLILIALLLVALIAFAGLLLDGGRVYAARRQSQNAADAAAFVGAERLAKRLGVGATEDSVIWTMIKNYAQQNGVADPNTNVKAWYMQGAAQKVEVGKGFQVLPQYTGVRVQATIKTDPFLMTVLMGNNAIDTMSQATMQSGVLTSFGGAMPMTVKMGSFSIGDTEHLMGEKTGPGGFQWLTYSTDCQHGGSAGELADNILHPPDNINKEADPSFNYKNPQDEMSGGLPHYFCTNSGISGSNQVGDALDYWFNDVPESQRYWIIPLYDVTCVDSTTNCQADAGTGGGSNMLYHIVGFAKFIPTGYYLSNSHSHDMTKDDCQLLDPKNPPSV